MHTCIERVDQVCPVLMHQPCQRRNNTENNGHFGALTSRCRLLNARLRASYCIVYCAVISGEAIMQLHGTGGIGAETQPTDAENK
jgi:hypothetical protein